MIDPIEALKLDHLSQTEKNQVVLKFFEAFSIRLSARVFKFLNETDRLEFEKLLEKGDQAKIEEFLRNKIPSLDAIQKEEAAGLLEEIKTSLTPNAK